MSKTCKTCGVVNGHRIGCQRSIARAALIKAVIDWHHASRLSAAFSDRRTQGTVCREGLG